MFHKSQSIVLSLPRGFYLPHLFQIFLILNLLPDGTVRWVCHIYHSCNFLLLISDCKWLVIHNCFFVWKCISQRSLPLLFSATFIGISQKDSVASSPTDASLLTSFIQLLFSGQLQENLCNLRCLFLYCLSGLLFLNTFSEANQFLDLPVVHSMEEFPSQCFLFLLNSLFLPVGHRFDGLTDVNCFILESGSFLLCGYFLLFPADYSM